MFGGAGSDRYVVNSSGDAVVEAFNAGSDTVSSSISYTLGSNLENLALTGSAVTGAGNDLNNVISGNSSANILRGNGGNDFLDGGLGNDAMIGGSGNDTYVVNSFRDSVLEVAGGGTDLVRSSVSFDLRTGADIENLTLLGTANLSGTGSDLANVIGGSSGNNTLRGLGGADVLDGGTGIDTMIGGEGDDIYIVDNAGDVVVENPGGGTDLVRSFATFDLSTAPEVENLTLLGSAGINGTGNGKTNRLTGNSGDNVLTGGDQPDLLRGGPGNDVLIGGIGSDDVQGDTGADVYRYNSAQETGDVVVFNQADGDRIRFQFDADTTTPAIKDPFTFIGTDPFDGTPGQIRFQIFGPSLTVVSFSVDLDTQEEGNLLLPGQINLTANDFGL
jgi:trimeric autotransporter adhesin